MTESGKQMHEQGKNRGISEENKGITSIKIEGPLLKTLQVAVELEAGVGGGVGGDDGVGVGRDLDEGLLPLVGDPEEVGVDDLHRRDDVAGIVDALDHLMGVVEVGHLREVVPLTELKRN